MKIGKILFWILVGIAVILAIILAFNSSVRATGTNISATSTEHFAWSDVSGWWDFYSPGTAYVWSTRLQGYASSSIGEISLDCKTTSGGDICSSSNYGVCNGPGPHNSDGTCPSGDGSGTLTGWGWNDSIGWISFNCDESSHGGSNDCSSSNYKVLIDSNGNFSGYAWNDVEGWISFSCANDSSCGTSNYKVATDWRATSTVGTLESSVFDTAAANSQLNSVTWRGSSPAGTCVDFQIATSTSADGPWTYYGPSGSTDYYGAACSSQSNGGVGCASQDTPVCVNRGQMSKFRYLRYKVRIKSNLIQTQTPQVNDVILNWSP